MKTKTQYVCQSCGFESPKWVGKCPGCGDWNSLVEEKITKAKETTTRGIIANQTDKPTLLTEVSAQKDDRWITQLLEFDRVMGVVVVPGGVTLIGGDPGIGKSTLSLQVACQLSNKDLTVLYVSGEESLEQTKLRADRITNKAHEKLFIVNQIELNTILDHIQKVSPDVVVLDSIQVVYDSNLSSTPGSVSQVRECASIMTQLAKARNMALFIIGHVTKEGMLAGPRVLEHIVDTVLYFEGERYSSYRVLRTSKNRFGSTNEIGVFEMTASGLVEVLNPSEIFLSERPDNAPGSVVVPILEGTRPFLVEVQGLVSRSAFGNARHKTQGFDSNRLALLVAVLEKRLSLNLQDQDVFLNIVGGVKVVDPAADLGVVMAVATAFLDKVLDPQTAVLGEVGLASEVRSVSHLLPRIHEAQKLGFKRCIVPKANLKTQKELGDLDIELLPVNSVKEAFNLI